MKGCQLILGFLNLYMVIPKFQVDAGFKSCTAAIMKKKTLKSHAIWNDGHFTYSEVPNKRAARLLIFMIFLT